MLEANRYKTFYYLFLIKMSGCKSVLARNLPLRVVLAGCVAIQQVLLTPFVTVFNNTFLKIYLLVSFYKGSCIAYQI